MRDDAFWHSLMEYEPPKTLGFVHGALDRAAALRDKPEAMARFAADPARRFIAFCGDNAVLAKAGEQLDALFDQAAATALGLGHEQIFLGLEDGAPRFAVILDPANDEALKSRDDLVLIGVRALALERAISPAHLGMVAQGKAMAFWHSRHRFCANCGSKTEARDGGWKRSCDACKADHFPRTDPVAIMLTVHGDRCLLGRQHRFVPNVYSTLAGFIEPGETIEAAVRRETFEESGIRTGRVVLIANQPWPFPESLMIGAFAEAISTEITRDEEELEDCRWFSRDEVIAMIEKRHPQGLLIPPRMAIANHLIRLFAGMKD
jgi:NAD+ diphosphatase